MKARTSRLIGAVMLLCLAGAAWSQPMAFTTDAKRFAKADGKAVSIFDAQTKKELVRFVGHTDDVTALAFAVDGKMLASGGKDGSVNLWDVATGKQICRFRVPNAVEAVLFAGDGRNIVIRESDRTLRELEIASGKEIRVTKDKK